MPALHPGHRSGRYYGGIDMVEAASTRVLAANRIYFSLIFITENINISRIGISVIQASGTGGRLGIYRNDDQNGWPKELFHDAGIVNTSTTGIKEIAINLETPAGWYWIAGLFDGTPTLTGKTSGEHSRFYVGVPNIVAGSYMAIYDYDYGTLPETIPLIYPEYGGTSGNNTHFPGAVPYFWFRTGV